MPAELAHDLATLALYDIVIFADDSGSMIFEEGGERIQDLKVIMGRVAEVATLFDEDGEHLAVFFCSVQCLKSRQCISGVPVELCMCFVCAFCLQPSCK